MATALTLVVIPVCYLLLERLKLRLSGKAGWEGRAAAEIAAGPAPGAVAP